MHELSMCRNLLRTAERVAAERGSGRVVAILVSIGPLAGVDGGQLARAFSLARKGTIAESAELTFEMAPVVVHCDECGGDDGAAPNDLLCRACGSRAVQLKSGAELTVRRVDLAIDTEVD